MDAIVLRFKRITCGLAAIYDRNGTARPTFVLRWKGRNAFDFRLSMAGIELYR